MSQNQVNSLKDEGRSQIVSLVSGVAVAYAITCIVFIGYAILLKFSRVSEENITIVVTITSLLAVTVAGFDAARGADKSGWFWGIIAGLLYVVILFAIGVFINKGFKFDQSSFALLILSVAGGGLGGIIGINFKK